MRAIVVGGAFAVVLIGVVIYEEGRIGRLEKRIAELEEQPVQRPSSGGGLASSGSVAGGPRAGQSAKGDRVKSAPDLAGAPEASEPREGDWAETFRQMIDNPVGRAMIAEEQKGKAQRIYGRLIDSLDLNNEEREYFVNLLAGSVGEEDTVGMKLFSAKSNEEREQILDQMEANQAARKEAIREFLNNEEDFARYERYDERKEIYEQMPGLRAALSDSGEPLTADQEDRLVDAIFQASVDSGMHGKWDGRAAFEQFGIPGATQRFREGWAQVQEQLTQSIPAILESPDQRQIFEEHQKQVGNMAVMGIQFVEGMVQRGQSGGDPE